MKRIINKLINEYKEKGFYIEIELIKETDISILFNIKVIINNKEYIHDLEIIAKRKNDVDFLRSNIDYLICYSLNKYLGGV